MRFVTYYIWIYFFFATSQNIFGYEYNSNSSSFRNYKLEFGRTKDQKITDRNLILEEFNKSPLLCPNSVTNTVVVQTVIHNKTGVNVPIVDDVLAIVYYKCYNRTIPGFVDEYRSQKFKKLCGNMSTEQDKFYNSWQEYSHSLKRGVHPYLEINLKLRKSTKFIKIQMEKCAQGEQTIFGFQINNTAINYRDQQDYTFIDDTFYAHNLLKSPIVLNITKFSAEVVAEIKFFIHNETTASCINDSKINSKYCSSSCDYNARQMSEKCSVKIENKKIELPEERIDCSMKGNFFERHEQKFNGSICEYFESIGQNPCKHSCIDLHKCSYMCVKESGGRLIEIGYEENFLKSFSPSPVGSGHWYYENIPIEMVFVNECHESLNLCEDLVSCIDEQVGYRCLYEDYTGKCSSLQTNRFWHCPLDDFTNSSSNNNGGSKRKFENVIDNILKEGTNSTNKFKQFMNYYYTYFTNYKIIPHFGTRRNDSYSALGYAIRLLDLLLDKELNDSHSSYYDNNEKGQAYVTYVNETAKEVSIPLTNNRSDGKNQFVKLIFKDTVKRKSLEKLALKFLRYKNVDMMGESNKIESQIKIRNLQRSNSRDIAVDNSKIYKNSDMFTLAITENRSVTVQYRMKTLYSTMTTSSWLYEFEEKCGYLDESSDHWSWSEKGCRKITTSIPNYCECDHLSNFAMMFAVKPINEIHLDILQYLSVMGGIVNIISLMLFLIFIIFINTRDKLRLDQLNIALCLFLGTIIFLIGGFSTGDATLCKLTALVAQFLFLSAFVWKLIFGVNVVRMVASLRYQNEDWIVKYRMVSLAIGYCVPLLIVVVSASLYWSSYGKVTDTVCWVEAHSNAFLSFIIPVGIILAINLIALFFIANTLIRNYMKTYKAKINSSSELIVFFQLVVSMGVTWVPSYFATVYVAAMYLFVMFFPLQGLLMFLIVVIMNRENREKVSSFVIQRYSSLISKSTSITDTKSNSKFKSSTRSKSTEQNQSLLSESEKGHEKDGIPKTVPMMTITGQDGSIDSVRHPVC